MRTIIRNAVLLTHHPGAQWIPRVSLVLDAGVVTSILEDPEAQDAHAEVIDAGGCVVLPGLINAHMHDYSALVRGMALDVDDSSFRRILETLWWRLDAALQLEDIRLSAALSALEGLRLGVTTVFDHHASYGCIEGSLNAVRQGHEAAGQRGVFCFEVSDRAGPDATQAALRENADYALEARRLPFALGSMLGLHASFTLSDATLEQAAQLAKERDLRIHIHAAEAASDRVEGSRNGSGIIDRLRSFDLLQPGALLAHGIHLHEPELKELAALGVLLSHNPSSNMNNGVGRLDLGRALRAGVQVVLGTDGYGFGILHEAGVAALAQRQEPRVSDGGWLRSIVQENNPALASLLLPGLGQLIPGAAADVVVTTYQPPTPLHADNCWSHVLFGNLESHVSTVFVAGERVLEDRRSTRLDEEELARGCREHAAGIAGRLKAGSA